MTIVSQKQIHETGGATFFFFFSYLSFFEEVSFFPLLCKSYFSFCPLINLPLANGSCVFLGTEKEEIERSENLVRSKSPPRQRDFLLKDLLIDRLLLAAMTQTIHTPPSSCKLGKTKSLSLRQLRTTYQFLISVIPSQTQPSNSIDFSSFFQGCILRALFYIGAIGTASLWKPKKSTHHSFKICRSNSSGISPQRQKMGTSSDISLPHCLWTL